MKREAWNVKPSVRRISWVLLAGALALPAQEAHAQRRGLRVVRPAAPELGPRVGYDFRVEDWSVGGQFRVPSRVIETLASGDSYFAVNRAWQLNLDLAVRLGRLSSLYAGGGLGIYHLAGTDAGPNLLVGLRPPARRNAPIRPYAEGRWTFLDGGTPFRLVFGVNLVLGR